MLSATKLGRRHLDYYLSYAQRGARGFWVGGAAAELGLRGTVDPAEFTELAEGRGPGGRRLLEHIPKNRTPGWDFSFSAPKSVSVCFALAGGELRERILDAHHRAVRSAIGFLEEVGGRARRGLAGRDGHVEAGLAVACFTHPSSRELDPQLHTHGLVLNVAHGADRRWTALDSRTLYLHKRAAASIYRAELRAEVAALGARWGEPDRRGLQEMAGIERAVLRAFSTRRAQIEARLAPGARSAAAQVACIATRRAKVDVELEALSAHWRARAAELGFDRGALERVLDGADRRVVPDDTARRRVEEELLSPEGLTKEAAAFTRDDTLVAWGRRLVQGASRSQLEALADHTLARSEVVPMAVADAEGRALSTGHPTNGRGVVRLVRRPQCVNGTLVCEGRYSTEELLAREACLLETATAYRGVRAAVVPASVVEAHLDARPALRDEQRTMVVRACSSGDLVEVVVGVPGSGKTFALEAAKAAWEAAGYRVLGCAFSAAAAAQLQAGSGIRSETFDSLRRRLSLGTEHLGPTTVVVVDEAGMLDTRRCARLVSWARRHGSKIVLAGDDRQLPAVEAGGAFAALARRLPATRLEDNARQLSDWERRALRSLREGRAAEAAGEYLRRGRVQVFSSPDELLSAMVARWWEARCAGEQTALYSYSRDAAFVLNAMARAVLEGAGKLQGAELVVPEHPALDLAERRYRAGDEICCLKNRARLGAGRDPAGLGVRNGTRGVVEEVEISSGEVVLLSASEEGRRLRLPADYVVRHTDYGYAWTLHKGQGQTLGQLKPAGASPRVAGRAFVYGADSLSAEAALVAASRATDSTELFVLLDPEEGREEAEDLGVRLARAWVRSEAQALASDELEVRRQIAEAADEAPDELARRRRELARALGMGPLADPVALEDRRRHELGAAAVALAELEDAVAGLSASLAGTGAPDERREATEALRRLLAERRELQAEAELARLAAEGVDEAISAQEAARQTEGSDLRLVGRHLEVVESALATRRQRLLDGLCADPPGYVARLLGSPPEDRARRLRWRQGAAVICDYRRSAGLDEADTPQPGRSAWCEALGAEPEGLEARRYRRVVEAVSAVRRDIGLEDVPLGAAVSADDALRQGAQAVSRASAGLDRRRPMAWSARGRGRAR
jgi:conjugative relaxase-like TrwC/TraI family protein